MTDEMLDFFNAFATPNNVPPVPIPATKASTLPFVCSTISLPKPFS